MSLQIIKIKSRLREPQTAWLEYKTILIKLILEWLGVCPVGAQTFGSGLLSGMDWVVVQGTFVVGGNVGRREGDLDCGGVWGLAPTLLPADFFRAAHGVFCGFSFWKYALSQEISRLCLQNHRRSSICLQRPQNYHV